MSKNSNRNTGGNNSGGFPVFAGIMLGMVMGLAIAGAIAWFILKKNPVPTPPVKETPVASKAAAAPEKSTPAKPVNATPGEGKARFEFYKELTDKPEAGTGKKAERQAPAAIKPVPLAKSTDSTAVYFLQEGAYTNADDADKVKAKLALIGMIANVQPANIPDKGVWYRVRLGPYKNADEMNEALATLKLNGLNASPIRTQ